MPLTLDKYALSQMITRLLRHFSLASTLDFQNSRHNGSTEDPDASYDRAETIVFIKNPLRVGERPEFVRA